MLQTNFDAVRNMAHESTLVKPTPTQARLSEYFIAPIRVKLISDLVKIRREIIDPQARAQLLKMDAKGCETYPIGYCRDIRNIVWEILQDDFRKMPSSVPGNFPYQLKLRKIWCLTRITSFQNAIQAGNYIIDAATDTVDPYRYPVKIANIEDSGLRNPVDHTDICGTIESSWNVSCYPNIYFPYLAPFFPVIGVAKEGKVGFMCTDMRHVDAKNLVHGDFLSARRFIFDSPFAHKRLLPEQLEQLYQIPPIGEEGDKHNFQAAKKPNLRSIEKMFAHVRGYSPEILAYIFLRNFRFLKDSALDIH